MKVLFLLWQNEVNIQKTQFFIQKGHRNYKNMPILQNVLSQRNIYHEKMHYHVHFMNIYFLLLTIVFRCKLSFFS